MKSRILFLFVSLLFLACNPTESYDLIIRNGAVYDGTGAPAVIQDIGIEDGKIVKQTFVGALEAIGK